MAETTNNFSNSCFMFRNIPTTAAPCNYSLKEEVPQVCGLSQAIVVLSFLVVVVIVVVFAVVHANIQICLVYRYVSDFTTNVT